MCFGLCVVGVGSSAQGSSSRVVEHPNQVRKCVYTNEEVNF